MADLSSENDFGTHLEARKANGAPFGHDMSLVHGWSMWPIFLLPTYIRGVRGFEPSWTGWCVRLVLVELKTVGVRVQILRGRVDVGGKVKMGAGRGEMKIRLQIRSVCEASPPKGW